MPIMNSEDGNAFQPVVHETMDQRQYIEPVASGHAGQSMAHSVDYDVGAFGQNGNTLSVQSPFDSYPVTTSTNTSTTTTPTTITPTTTYSPSSSSAHQGFPSEMIPHGFPDVVQN